MNIFYYLKKKVSDAYYDTRYRHQRAKNGYGKRDLWDIDSWLTSTLPRMLQDYNTNRMGYPGFLLVEYCKKHNLNFEEYGAVIPDSEPEKKKVQDEMYEECDKQWNDIVNKMTDLFLEANEVSCSKKNKYEEEFYLKLDEFEEKYGYFGEKLRSEEEIEAEKTSQYFTWHSMSEIPEYKKVADKYYKEERRLDKYRRNCRKKALQMFIEYGESIAD